MKEKFNIISVIFNITSLMGLLIIYFFSYFIKNNSVHLSSSYLLLLIISLILVLLLSLAYKFAQAVRFTFRRYFKNLIRVYVIFTCTIFAVSFLYRSASYSRLFITLYMSLYFTLLLIFYFLFKVFFKSEIFRSKKYNIIIIGAGVLGKNLFNELHNPIYNYNIIGFLDDKPKENNLSDYILGKIDALEKIINENHIDEIFITIPLINEDIIKEIIELSNHYGIKIKIIPNYYQLYNKNVSMTYCGDLPIINIREVPLENIFNRVIKRVFDILFSLVVLIFGFPIYALIAIAIKIDSKGPIFFNPLKIGHNKKKFKMHKFRTMVITPPEIHNNCSTIRNDPRITRFGSFIRKSNIDELPQFFNVLKGEMSVVGPRPHRVSLDKEFQQTIDNYMLRHLIKPGISGWAQANGWRGPTDTRERMQKRIEYDLWYMENWSFWLDMKIIFLTLFGKKVKNNAF